MDPGCLQHVLTPDQRREFEETGLLAVPGAVDEEQRLRLIEIVDRVDARERTAEHGNRLLSRTNVLHEDRALADLVCQSTVLPKVWGVLGWNIYCYHSHLDVTPPMDERETNWRVAWHQDSMRVNDEIETHPRPRLSLKVGYYLTDVSEPGRGNTLVVPGSQLHDQIDCPQDGSSSPEGAEPLCVPAGTAVLLDRRVWHTRSANTSNETRKVIWIGYSYRWMQPKDQMTVGHLLPELDPIHRQMLGDRPSNNSLYDPQEGDVPLRAWLEQHHPESAAFSHHGADQSRPPAMVRGNNLGRQ